MVDTLIKTSQSGYLRMGNAKEWDDEFLTDDGEVNASVQSTLSPILMEATEHVGVTSSTIITISLVALSVILAIVILFALAIFIDYRQQKLQNQNKQNNSLKKRKTYPRINLPRCRRAREDTSHIASNAEGPGISRPPLETIIEDV